MKSAFKENDLMKYTDTSFRVKVGLTGACSNINIIISEHD